MTLCQTISMSETEILKACLDYLHTINVFVWRNNNVGIYNQKTGKYYFHGIKGVSDILGIYKGKFLAVEVKTPDGKLSEDQQLFLDKVDEEGGNALIVRSVDELIEDLSNL